MTNTYTELPMGHFLSALQISYLSIFLEYHFKYIFLLHIVLFQTVIVIGSKHLDLCLFI